MISRKILAAAALAACGTLAHADQVGAYIGGNLGYATYNVDCQGYYVSCDDNDTGYKLFGGYNFTKQWGVEVDYIDFGKATWTDTFYRTKALGLSGSMLGAAGVFNFDFGVNSKWAGAARLGLGSVTLDGSGYLENGSQSNTKLYGGFDVTYAITPQVKLRGGLDLTSGEYTTIDGYHSDGGMYLFSVGLSVHF